MPHIETMFSNYLKAASLEGKDVSVRISGVSEEEFEGNNGKELKWVLHFAGTSKGLVLNKTNAGSIATLYGPITDEWPNKVIVLYPTRVMAFGSETDAIRIRENAPAPASNGAAAVAPAAPTAPPVVSAPAAPTPDDDGLPF